MMKTEDLLFKAITAAISGSHEIKQVYGKEFTVDYKDDRSPLTEADRRAHQAITRILAPTGIPILSEEGRNIPFAERKSWSRFWLVDPLDGTKEFVKRNGEFTVNIALIDNGKPVAGVIHVPVTGVLYFGAYETGAYKTIVDDVDGVSLAGLISGASRMDGIRNDASYLVVASRSHMSEETLSFIEKLKEAHPDLGFVSIGSSLKLCLVAEGQANIYPRFGPTMEWDTAAGHALVEISGGYVVEAVTTRPLTYNKENLLNPWFIAGRK